MRFYSSAHAALVSGIQESIGVVPSEKLSVMCDFMLAMIEGVLLRAQVYGSADMDQLFDVMRTSILLLLQELVASASGQSTLVGRISDVPRSVEPSGA